MYLTVDKLFIGAELSPVSTTFKMKGEPNFAQEAVLRQYGITINNYEKYNYSQCFTNSLMYNYSTFLRQMNLATTLTWHS